MKEYVNTTNLRKTGINELLKLLQELNRLKNSATDSTLRKDYEIYTRDIHSFLERAAFASPSLEDIQVYIDDYRSVVQHVKDEAYSA